WSRSPGASHQSHLRPGAPLRRAPRPGLSPRLLPAPHPGRGRGPRLGGAPRRGGCRHRRVARTGGGVVAAPVAPRPPDAPPRSRSARARGAGLMWLALDTATDRAQVVLGAPGVILARAEVVGARRHAAELLPAIERCLAAAASNYGALEGIVLADGPGSFTGLRVSAAVAKALVRARPMPLWVAPSLLVCAAGAGAGPDQVVL